MASRGSALSRAVKFFREGDLDEVRVAFKLVEEAVEKRLKAATADAPKRTRRARKPRIGDAYEPAERHASAAASEATA